MRSLNEHIRKKNPFIMPYTSSKDDRLTLTWLKVVFLQYLENRKKSTISREGKYSTDERQKMFLSQQTLEGLKISVYSHIKAITFLLAGVFEYVLTEHFIKITSTMNATKQEDQTTQQRNYLGTMI